MSSIIDFISDNFSTIISIIVVIGFIQSFFSQKENKKKTESKTIPSDKDSGRKQKYHPSKAQVSQSKSTQRNIDAVYPIPSKKRSTDKSPRRNQRAQQLKSQKLTPSGNQVTSGDSFKTSIRKQSPYSAHQVQTELRDTRLEVEQTIETKTSFLGELNQEERHQRFREAIILKEIFDSPKAIKKMNKRKYIK